MLTAQVLESEFAGYGFSGSAAVQTLQQQLAALAQAANWPAVNPGQITGTVTTQTIIALANVIPQLAGLDSTAKQALSLALQGAVAMGAVSPEMLAQAQKAVEQYATYLTGAVGMLIVKYGKASAPPPVTQPNPAGIKIVSSAVPAAVAAMAGRITTRTAAGVWRVAVPKAAGLGGPLGASYTEVAPSTSQPAGATVVSAYTFNLKTGSLPWYKDWRFLVPIGVGVAGATVLGVWWWRH